MTDAVLKGRPIEQRRCQNVQCVEPSAGLVDVFDDEVAWVMRLEPFTILERIVHLRERHRTALEPAVEHLGHAAHHRATCWIVGVRSNQIVDSGTMQVGDLYAKVALHLGQAAVDVHARVFGVIALPHRNRRTPETVAADAPVARIGKPLAKRAIFDVTGNPMDLLVQFDHAILDCRDLNKPRRDRAVDQRLSATPAMRIAVVIALVTQHDATSLQFTNDQRVGIKHMLALPRRHLGRIATVLVHWAQRGYASSVTCDLVVLAESRGHMHDTGAVFGADEIGTEHLKRIRCVGEEIEQWGVAPSNQIGAHQRAHACGLADLAFVRIETRLSKHVTATIRMLHHCVFDVGAHGQRKVGGQRPRRGGPCQQVLASFEFERNGQRRVLTIAVDIVHARLGVAERSLATPAICQHAETFVDQTLVVQCAERPHHALHVRQVEGLVVVGKVDPARLTPHIALPLAGVAQHTGAADFVELVDAELGDLGVTADAQFFFGLNFGRKTVTVPPEATLNTMTAHRLITRHGIFHVAGEQVPVVRQAVGKGRAVVENELVIGEPW